MKRSLPIVIAIAGVSGGGKTVVTTELEGKLHNSKALFFDDYDFIGPDDFVEWVKKGSNPEEWDLSPLISDIKKFRMEPLDYIVLDYPFADLHSQPRELIDFTVFIDTPLDIAMARRIIRDYKEGSAIDILQDLNNYIVNGRKGYLDMLNNIKPNADLIVDGELPVEDIVKDIISNIPREKL